MTGEGAAVLLLLASPAGDLEPQSLADAIRIQVVDLGLDVAVEDETAPDKPVSTRLAAAVERMEAAGARMVLFYDHAEGEDAAVLYVARPSDERAVVTVIRLDRRGDDAALYRAFGLKVRDLVVDTLRIERAEVPAQAPPPPPTRWAVTAGYGVAPVPSTEDVRHGPHAGVLLELPGLVAHADLGVLLPSEASLQGGHAELTSASLHLGLRVAPQLGPVQLGVGPVLGATLHVAQAEDANGREGEVARAVPSVGADLFGRWRFHPALAVAAGARVATNLVEQHFTVGGGRVFDLGLLAVEARIGLVLSLPWPDRSTVPPAAGHSEGGANAWHSAWHSAWHPAGRI